MTRSTTILLFFAVYTVGYIALAIANVNPEGTGTAAFLLPLGPWILLLGSVYALIRSETLTSWRLLFILFSIAHYVATIVLFTTFSEEPFRGESRLSHAWTINKFWVVLTIAWYLVGQAILWILFVRENSKTRIE